VPPDVGTLKPPTSNIDTLLKDAEAFLISVDPKLRGLVEKHTCRMFSPEGLREVVEPFTALASGIMGQQVCAAFFCDRGEERLWAVWSIISENMR